MVFNGVSPRTPNHFRIQTRNITYEGARMEEITTPLEMEDITTPLELELYIQNVINFSQYLNHNNNNYRVVMAKYGKEIDKLLTYDYQSNNDFDDVKVALINKGYAKEHWDKWKNDGQLVREALVKKGYDIDYFMNDESESVRFTICKHYPERIPQLITKSADDYNNAFLVLVDSMDEKLLELVVKHYDEKDIERNSPFAYESYKIVYESMVREPTAIEKTMTRTQLFLSGNPLWAQGMTQRKANMLRAYYESSKDDNKEKDFLKHFDKMSSPETSIWGMKDIYFNL